MELALPITVYWDLPRSGVADDHLLRLCGEILDCRPLMLQLYDPSPELSDAARGVLQRFSGTPVSLSLTVPLSALPSLEETPPDSLGVKELLVVAESSGALAGVALPPGVGISCFVNRENWRGLPDLLIFCRERGVKRLVLPMQRIYKGEEPFFISRSEQGELESSLAAVGGVGDLRLTIHDPFLWRAFNPGIPFPQGGCQAANTMIAISPDGGIYPCPTLPVKLGETGVKPLKEIILSSAKKELRSRILEYPAGCGDCQELTVCRGGCRGRSYVMHGAFDGIDDACR